uniref:Uncharacterized protein n=1 Tax=viral metagenome TaxID=1070528 RepID=A0A6C0BCE0_9ZZZZ
MQDNIEFQIISSFASGILFGGLSRSIFFTILFVLAFEFCVIHYSRFYPPEVMTYERVIVNIFFLLGWILGRILMLNETGFEDIVEFFERNNDIREHTGPSGAEFIFSDKNENLENFGFKNGE